MNREEGWYWVKHDLWGEGASWEVAQCWVDKRTKEDFWYIVMDDTNHAFRSFIEVGPRIPTPDELQLQKFSEMEDFELLYKYFLKLGFENRLEQVRASISSKLVIDPEVVKVSDCGKI